MSHTIYCTTLILLCIFCITFIIPSGSLKIEKSQCKPVFLRCEYLENPLAIGSKNPRLSWTIESDNKNVMQTAYRIIVSRTLKNLKKNNGDLWDSGKIASDRTAHILYDGKNLESRTKCFWKVKIWDNYGNESEYSKPAFWITGLLKIGSGKVNG